MTKTDLTSKLKKLAGPAALTTLAISLVSIFSFPRTALAFRWDCFPGYGMMGGYGTGGFGFMFMILFWALIGVGIYSLITRLVKTSQGGRGQEGASEAEALKILKSRYARGDIEREEFEQKKRDLEAV